MSVPIQIRNATYTFVAALSAGVVSVFAIFAGIILLFSERTFEDLELPTSFLFFATLGTTGIAVVWCSFLAVIAAMFLCERQRIAVSVVIVAATLSSAYFIAMFLSSLRIWLNILWSIT